MMEYHMSQAAMAKTSLYYVYYVCVYICVCNNFFDLTLLNPNSPFLVLVSSHHMEKDWIEANNCLP